MNIVGYARLSRDSEESTSISRQRELIEREADKRGYTLLGVESDTGLSGSLDRTQRPGLDRALRLVESGEADAVMVWRLDRIARSVLHYVTILNSGVHVISATEPVDSTTPMGKAVAQVLAVFAELELETIRARNKASRVYLVQHSRWPGGRVPYGYMAADGDEGKVLVINPDEAAVVTRMADEILAGKTLYAVAMALNDEGIPTKYGKQWSNVQIRRILTADSSAGYMTHGGEVVRDERGLPVQAWPALIEPERLARLRAILTPREEREPRRKRSRLLSGLIYCEGCGGRMVVNATAGRKARYVCSSGYKGVRCPASASVIAEYVEAEVVQRFLTGVGFIPVTEFREVETGDNGLTVVESAIRDLAAKMSEPDADVAALAEQIIDLKAEAARIRALPMETRVEATDTGRTFAELWEDADEASRRDLLTDAGCYVQVRRAEKRGPFDPARVRVEFMG